MNTLTSFKKTALNHYFKVTREFEAWVLVGHRPSNAYYGSARLQEPVYKKVMVRVGQQVHILCGGDFLIEKGKVGVPTGTKVQFYQPEFRPFEKNYGYDATRIGLPMECLEEIPQVKRLEAVQYRSY